MQFNMNTYSYGQLKVLHVLDHSLPVQSGYAFRSQAIITAQRRRGWAPIALTSPKHYESWGEGWKSSEEIGAIRYYRASAIPGKRVPLLGEIQLMLALTKRLAAVAREHVPNILHPHSPVLNALPALSVGKRFGIPVVYEMRSSWEDAAVDRGLYTERSWKYKATKALETFVCRRADAVVVISDGLRRELIERGIPAAKIVVVPNGVDVDIFMRPGLSGNRTEPPQCRGRRVIGFMGSFFKWEGLDLLLNAMANLEAVRGDVELLLVGGGEMELSLRERIKDLKLDRCVTMPGQVTPDRIPGLYSQVDVMAFPRYSTRLTEMVTPLKPLEAMAMEKVVVASDVGGHKELIRHGETGLLFKAGDLKSLVRQLTEVLDNVCLRQSLQDRAALWVRKERTWNDTTQGYEEVYNRIMPASFRCHELQ
jgi:PEP-CTERM/exosortase A-associated glycosyltransferase